MISGKIIIFIFIINITPITLAEVVLDGTLGTIGALEGPDFLINANLGQQTGSNLFHSFQSFNLTSAESATFTGPPSINNIISRVTGGQASHLDGWLGSTIPHADLYFLNPAGVVFGPHAQIDVPASLYVSTADYLKLGEAGHFDATTPENTLLAIAPPSAFGFLDQTPASIAVEGSQLILTRQSEIVRALNGEDIPISTLALIGGDITIQEGMLYTFGSDVNLVSVASKGEAPIEPSQFTDNTFATYGTLSITDTVTNQDRSFGNIQTSGRRGGAVFIRSGQFLLDRGWIFADTLGDQTGRGITIHASETFSLKNASRITTEIFNNDVFDEATGAAGHIDIHAGQISVTEGSQIVSAARRTTSGDAGNIALSVRDTLFISGTDDSEIPVPSGVLSNTLDSGRGGNITISADRLVMNADALMSTDTWGLGDAGNLSIRVKNLEMLGGAQISSGIDRADKKTQGTGKGGTLTIEAAEAVLISGVSTQFDSSPSGLLSNNITGQGPGGTIKITAPEIVIEKGGNIQAITVFSGDAGHIIIEADSLKLDKGGIVATNTLHGTGAGGNVEIVAHQAVLIQGQNTGITAAATGDKGSGPSGEVKITTNQLQLTEGGGISASSQGQGQAGNIVLVLGDQLKMQTGSIRTSTARTDGGNIEITTPSYLYLTNGEITTSVKAEQGNGGNISLKPEFIILDNSHIFAKAVSGDGGNINISTTGIYNFSGEPLPEVINASSQFGVDGVIVISSPEGDVSEGLIILPSTFFAANLFPKTLCTLSHFENRSHFVVIPFAGSPPTPEDWQGSPLLSY